MRVFQWLLLIGFAGAVFAAVNPYEESVSISKAVYLRLMISDEIREDTGLWEDPLHWRVMVLTPEYAHSNFGMGSGEKPGIYIMLDHPNGVDVSRYIEGRHVILTTQAELSAKRVLESQGWMDDFHLKVDYARAVEQELLSR